MRERLLHWRPSRRTIAITVICALGIALRALIPPLLRWTNRHDDLAQVTIADALLRGEWLGAWGDQGVPHITLAKGPGYPLFLAALEPTGLPPQLAAYLIYLAGVLVLTRATTRRLGGRWQVLAVGVLAFNPVAFTTGMSIVYRDALVIALAPLALGLAVALAHRVTRAGRWGARGWVAVVAEAALLAAVLGWLSITRGDVLWIVLGSVGGLVVGLLPHLRALGRRGWLTVSGGAVLVALIAAAFPATVAELNQRHYGVHLVDDYGDGTFAEAITLWSSVLVDEPETYQNVSRAQREAVYAISPTATRLEAALEADGTTWVQRNCTWHEDVDLPCADYGSYFTWAARDAAVATGMASTAADFQAFFGRIADDIRTACDTGELTCGRPGLSPDVPPLDRMPVRLAIANVAGFAVGSFSYDGTRAQIQRVPPRGADVDTWAAVVNGTDGVLDTAASGLAPDAVGQRAIGDGLSRLYGLAMTIALVPALASLVLRRTWTTTTGRTALVVIAAWLVNLGIVAVFYAGTNRSPGAKMPLYTMASQSYLLLGLVLASAVTLTVFRERLAAWAGRGPTIQQGDTA